MKTFDKYQAAAIATAKYAAAHALTYPALGLASEAGEVCGQVKRVLRDDGGAVTPERREKLLDETGDCLWYLAALAGDLGESLSEVARRNIAKLRAREKRGTIHGQGDDR